MVKSQIAQRAGSSAIRDLLELTEAPHIVSLAGGLPNPRTFPVAELAEATRLTLADDPDGALQYGPTEGYRPLREWAARRSGTNQGGAEQVLITSGSQQGLELLARALVDPGSPVALADPAYVGALQAFRGAGADLVAVERDEHGLCVDRLAARLAAGLRPVAVYVVANFDNPTGTTLSADRRIALAALAERYGFWIIDDDPYGDLRWAGSAPPPLRELTGRTITLGSTSKVLAPGLRVGWAVAPVEVRRVLTILKQAADLHTSSLSQRVVHRVVTTPGLLDQHVAHLRRTYRHQAEALAGSLRRHLGDALSFAPPTGGMFLWADLADPEACSSALLATALDHGVAFVPGAAFSVDAPHRRSLRLSFATVDPPAAEEAARRLLGAVGAS